MFHRTTFVTLYSFSPQSLIEGEHVRFWESIHDSEVSKYFLTPISQSVPTGRTSFTLLLRKWIKEWTLQESVWAKPVLSSLKVNVYINSMYQYGVWFLQVSKKNWVCFVGCCQALQFRIAFIWKSLGLKERLNEGFPHRVSKRNNVQLSPIKLPLSVLTSYIGFSYFQIFSVVLIVASCTDFSWYFYDFMCSGNNSFIHCTIHVHGYRMYNFCILQR